MAAEEVVYRSDINGQRAEVLLVEAATRTYRLTVDGIPQSQVCLADPALVDFDYLRHIARLIDAQGPEGAPLTCAHLGGGALTLPRYVGVTRPGSVQYVVESETERTADLLGILPLPAGCDVRFLFGDARAVVDSSSPWRGADVTVVDLWAGSTVVARVSSLEFYRRLAAMCAPGALLAVNLPDADDFRYTRRQAAALGTVFEHVAVVRDRHLLDERTPDRPLLGNVLIVASNRPLGALAGVGWPVGDHNPPHVLIGNTLRAWVADSPPATDNDATDSPSPLTGDHAGDAGD